MKPLLFLSFLPYFLFAFCSSFWIISLKFVFSIFICTVTFFLSLKNSFFFSWMFLLSSILFLFHGYKIHFYLWRQYAQRLPTAPWIVSSIGINWYEEFRLCSQFKCQYCHWLWQMTLDKLPGLCLSVFSKI